MKRQRFWEEDYGVVPIPLREDVIVRFHGLPHDITAEEAEKVCRVIKAYASPTEQLTITQTRLDHQHG